MGSCWLLRISTSNFGEPNLPFLIQARNDDHALVVTTETAKEAFSKAVEWQVIQLSDVLISDGSKFYTVSKFASFMALKTAPTRSMPLPS